MAIFPLIIPRHFIYILSPAGFISKAINKVISLKDTLKSFIVSTEQKQLAERPKPSNVDHSTITLAVYGLESGDISEVIESIRSNIGKHFVEKLLNSERDVNLIGKLKNYQVKIEFVSQTFADDRVRRFVALITTTDQCFYTTLSTNNFLTV